VTLCSVPLSFKDKRKWPKKVLVEIANGAHIISVGSFVFSGATMEHRVRSLSYWYAGEGGSDFDISEKEEETFNQTVNGKDGKDVPRRVRARDNSRRDLREG